MANSIDEKVVKASFDNAEFLKNIQTTLTALTELNKGLKLQGATKGLQDLGAASKGLNLNNLGESISSVSSKFSALSVIAISALASITAKAVDTGLRVAKAFTIDPITAGFKNYETQINAVQTILANTGLKGSAGLQQVTDVLGQLNEYANKTVYNFSEMAQNIGTFTAAGVKLQPAADAIKGIANLAAMSGANSQQASMAMYQLSQAIAANKVGLQDWNSVVNAGLGGKVFQEALFNTAKQLHTIKDVPMGQTFQQWTDAGNSFRGSLQDGWITGKVLTDTLAQFTGDLTDAQLKSMGYNDAQIKSIQELAKTANDAATQIKTAHQMIDALKEEVASAWSSVFKTLFGDINQAKGLFTPLHNVLQNLLTGPVYALNNVLQGWVAFGGKVKLMDAVKTGAKDLKEIFGPIIDGFHQIFPAGNGFLVMLLKLTKGIDDLVHRFKLTADSATDLHRTFAGVFAIFDIGWQVIKQVAHFIGDLFGQIHKATAGGGGGILDLTARFGDWLVMLDNAIKHGEGLRNFFVKLEDIIKNVGGWLSGLIGWLSKFGSSAKDVGGKALDIFGRIGEVVATVFGKIKDFFKNMFKGLTFDNALQIFNVGLLGGLVLLIKKFMDYLKKGGNIGGFFKGLVHSFTEPFDELTKTLKGMQTTLRATTIVEIAIAVGVLTASVVVLSKINTGALAKALTAIGVMFGILFGGMTLMTQIGTKGFFNGAAGMILMAEALKILADAVKKLGDLSWDEIGKGLTATIVLLAGLTAAAQGMSGVEGSLIRAGASLILLAYAIKVLDDSVKDFAQMDWGQIAKGLTGVGALLGSLVLFTKFSDANGAGLRSGAGIVLLAAGIKILASAAKDFSSMSWGEIVKGLANISAILAAVAVFSKTVGNPLTLMASGAALIAIGAAMNELARAMQSFGNMNWGQIAKGLVSMAGALALITVALNAMPATSILSAGALVAISVALVGIGHALEEMGGQSWGDTAKGLITLAGSLTILAAACYVMEGALPGAAAILVVSAALVPLATALKILGSMSIGDIVKGLATLAGAFAVLGVAALVLTPVIPMLLALGAALTVMGIAVAATGAGVFLFGLGLTSLAASGTQAAAALGAIAKAVVGVLVTIAKGFADILKALADSVTKALPSMLKMAVGLIDTMLSAIDTEAPKILKTFLDLILSLVHGLTKSIPQFATEMINLMIGILKVIGQKAPLLISAFTDMVINLAGAIAKNLWRFISAGIDMINSILSGIAKKLPEIVAKGADIIIKFVQAIGDQGVRITNAALDTIVKFVNGLADAIRSHNGQLRDAGGNLAAAIADGLSFGLTSKIGELAGKAAGMAGGIIKAAKDKLGVKSPSKVFYDIGTNTVQGFINGITHGSAQLAGAWHGMGAPLDAFIKSSQKDIDKYSLQLFYLSNAQQKNAGAIYLTAMALKQATDENRAATKALADLNLGHWVLGSSLDKLSKQWDAYTPKIEAATTALNDAKKVRDDFAKQTADQFNVLPDISNDTQLTDYINSLQYQVNDMTKFTEVLTELRKLGLNDAVYKELLSKGPASLQFAEQLLAGGSTAVKNIDGLSDQLGTAAGNLGTAAGTALYQAGVDAAQGIVDGLKKQQDAISAQMSAIAKSMTDQIKRDLGIKSPSTVMAALGDYVAQGLSQGLRGAVPDVVAATKFVGNSAIESMREALKGANDLINESVDVNPTIAPVVDLSNVSNSVAQLDKMLADKKLSIDATVTSATDASRGYLANKQAASEAVATDGTVAPVQVSFTQNNNSPKALSTAEIYRNTNNQLSRVKGALNVATAVGGDQ